MIATALVDPELHATVNGGWTTVCVVTTAVTTGTVVVTTTAAGSAPLPPSRPRRPVVEKSAVDQRREFLQRQREHARRPR